jgi:hypothetical protein
MQAYRSAYSNTPVEPEVHGLNFPPEGERVCNPYDDHHNAEACALMGGDPPQ